MKNFELRKEFSRINGMLEDVVANFVNNFSKESGYSRNDDDVNEVWDETDLGSSMNCWFNTIYDGYSLDMFMELDSLDWMIPKMEKILGKDLSKLKHNITVWYLLEIEERIKAGEEDELGLAKYLNKGEQNVN